MDLSSIFGLNSRFGAVWEGIRAFPHWVRSHALNSLVYQRVLAPRLLGPSRRRRSGFAGQRLLSHRLSCASVIVVTGWCDEKSERGLVWESRFLLLRSGLRTTPNPGMWRHHRGPLLKKREKGRTPSLLVPTIKGNSRQPPHFDVAHPL